MTRFNPRVRFGPRMGSRGDGHEEDSRGLWAATYPAPPPVAEGPGDPAGPGVEGHFDVVVVGAGYTGLWTARSLARAEPSLRILVVERATVGFGASGRNGGWCSALLPIGLADLARRHGRDAAVAWQRAMFDAVGDVEAFATTAPIDPQLTRGGTVTLARTERQLARLRAEIADARALGFGEDDRCELSAAEATAMCAATSVRGGAFTPHCAAVHPLRLVHALAADARGRGVRIVEGTAVTDVRPGGVSTTAGTARAETVVLATEAFTVELPGHRRDLLPVYSLMIGSEPLTDDQWAGVGLAGRATFADARRTVIYGQRTADGRLAFGGRGAPYHLGSRLAPAFDRDPRVRVRLEHTVAELFPALAGVRFEHHWGGAVAVPRDWHPQVTIDRIQGLARAGGYVGDGVATANLAGRTLADLILRRDTALTRLPWVGHRSRPWEPEPLRWIGVRLAAAAARRADEADAAARRTAGAWDRAYELLT